MSAAKQGSFEAAVRDQLALLEQGKPLEAFDRYFDHEGVMFDNDEVFGRGKVECRAKQEPFISSATRIIGKITQRSIDHDLCVCAFRNQSTFVDGSGAQHQIDGVHWQRWSGGTIAEERYYRDELMQQKIAEGILQQGSKP
jgi:hypothetical protein